MSDLFEARAKTEKGAEWRGSINVPINDEQHTLTVRQLRDPEQWEVMAQVDTDELEALQDKLPEEKMEEYNDLTEKDNLTDEESDRLEQLQAEVEDADMNLFDELSFETYNGLKQAAKYGIEPDQEDIREVLTTHTEEINDQYGGTSEDDARQFIQDNEIEPMIENSTDFTSFTLGVKVLGETLGDTKN